MQKIKVDGLYDYLIEKIQKNLFINGEKKEYDIIKKNDQDFHIIHDNRSYTVSVLSYNASDKSLDIKVNKHIHKVELIDESDLLLEKMGIRRKQSKKSINLRAPMPGLIVDIKVSESQNVEKGDPLIILKAMKMENILRSPTEATVKQILVEKNQKVEKDQVIIQF